MRACVNCQKRKSRCLRGSAGGEGPCSYCSRTSKTCSFETPPDRTPLTRKNLNAAERRCAQLRSLLSSLNPDLDIDSALDRLSSDRGDAHWQAPQETDESTPGSYEWHEGSLSPESKSTAQDDMLANDGMATLSTEDAGYLGSSSGSHLLGEIDSVITNGIRQGYRRAHRKHYHAHLPDPDPPDLPLSYVASHLVDAYFLLYNTCYPVLHEKTFRDRVAARHQQRQAHSPWRVTYYMVLAIGHWASTTESEHSQSNYYTAARTSLSFQMLESGTIETVLAFLLMGNYLQKRDRTNTGYNFIGLAYRLSLGLGLHRESLGTESTIGHERRRQIFWTTYCFDSGFNITTGRPPTMADRFADTRLPCNIDDKDLTLSSPVPGEVDYPTTYSAIIAQGQLARIADEIYHEFLLAKISGTKIEYRLAESMERGLDHWRRSLPSYFTAGVPGWFRGPRAVVQWKEQNIRILLWHGSQKYHSFLPTKVNGEEKCLEAAMQTIHDISVFCTGYDGHIYQSVSWYATYFLFQAALVLVASFLNKGPQDESGEGNFPWQHSVFKARECLKMLSGTNRSAARCLQTLDHIHSQFQSLPTMNLDANRDLQQSRSPARGEEPTVLPNSTPPDPAHVAAVLPSENDFTLYGDSQGVLSDENSDPNLRMLINEMSFDLMENMPLDLLLNDWVD